MLNLGILNNLNLIKLCIKIFKNIFEENNQIKTKKTVFRKPGLFQGKNDRSTD